MFLLANPKFLLALFCVHVWQFAAGQDVTVIKKIRECFTKEQTTLCLKEKALDVINETINNDKPLNIYGFVDIVKDPNYKPNATEDENILPADLTERNQKLNQILYDKVEEFVHSRSMKVNLGNVFEGRGKKGGKKGGMMMLGGLAMMGMMAQMFMGKIAFLAGAALLVAKMALMLSAIIGLKKLSGGGGGGGESHIVYTSGGDNGYGHSHGGGGWHRSLDDANAAQNLAYRGHVTEVASNNY